VTVQPGIFALGTTDHGYLELDLVDNDDLAQVLHAVDGLVEELSTTAGVNLVVGVRPSLWQKVSRAEDVPASAADWQDDLVGPDGFTMPATQHDLWLWLSGGSRTAIFDTGRLALSRLADSVHLRRETTGWLYRHDRDLTGFIDGTENPSLLEAPSVVGVPAGEPGAGSSVVLFQLWRHDSARWEQESVDFQEHAMGRTKGDSDEFPEAKMPADAHVARTKLVVDGTEQHIFRRNVAYGGITDHGTVFVGFSLDQWRLAEMLRRMAGVPDGIRCALTRYLTPYTGGYYVIPSIEALDRFA
jgi:putative iron-dependent peroxidase